MQNLQKYLELFQGKLGYTPKQVELISADVITPETLTSVRNVYGADVKIVQQIDPTVVGGLKIRVGDFILDAGVDSNTEDLSASLLKAETTLGKSVLQELTEQINKFTPSAKIQEVGEVLQVKDGIILISGLTNCMYQEVLEFNNGTKALVLNLEEKTVGAVVLGEYRDIKEGDLVKRTKEIMSVAVGADIVGRVVNSLGKAIDGGSDFSTDAMQVLEKVAPGVMDRQPVVTPLQTGIKSIDALIPIGKGQRELILGDRQTGKTAIAIDTIINQKGQDVICVYVAIGQKESKVATLVAKLKKAGAMDYTVVVSTGASEAAPMLYLAPYTGVAIAEYFLAKGKDVLVVYDDLSKHAVAYRELSLLLRRPPGREAYPGDVFYLHSRLLERACRLSNENGGGSITALPIIETQAGDISAYIPTNVISITDGQIFLETDLFYRGVRPAINVGLSVSRVGGSAQIKPMKKVAGSLKLALAQFRELEAFAQLSADLDPKTKSQIERGQRITEVIKQKQYAPLPVAKQVAAIYAVNNGYFDGAKVEEVSALEADFLDFLSGSAPDLLTAITAMKWDEEIEKQLKQACENFLTRN